MLLSKAAAAAVSLARSGSDSLRAMAVVRVKSGAAQHTPSNSEKMFHVSELDGKMVLGAEGSQP